MSENRLYGDFRVNINSSLFIYVVLVLITDNDANSDLRLIVYSRVVGGAGIIKLEGGGELEAKIIDVVYFSKLCTWLRDVIITGVKSASEFLVQPKKLLETNY